MMVLDLPIALRLEFFVNIYIHEEQLSGAQSKYANPSTVACDAAWIQSRRDGGGEDELHTERCRQENVHPVLNLEIYWVCIRRTVDRQCQVALLLGLFTSDHR